MKLSNETLSILKNFASINTNIVFKPGLEISTISSSNSVFAKATIKEEIPRGFAIYDLNALLSVLTIVENQKISFEDKMLIASSDKGKFEYFYSDPEVVKAAPDGTIEHQEVYKFKLTSEDIQMFLKAAQITKAPTISVTNKNQNVSVVIGDRKNLSANNFKKNIGTSFNQFDIFVAVENLKVIPDAYEVTVGKTGKAKFLHFKHESKDLQYWIAAEPGSEV